jgi:hypothetical protein
MEREWRLVKPLAIGLQDATTMLFRPGRNGIVPYMKVPLCIDGAEYLPNQIYIGPNADMPAASTAFKTFLDCCHSISPVASVSAIPRRRFTGPIEVEESKTPYHP